MKLQLSASLTLVGAVIVTSALAGCSTGGLPGGSSPAANASAGSSSNPSSSSSGNSGSGSNRTFTLPPACLSATEVATTLGVDAYGPTKSGDSTSLVCEYLTPTKDGPIIDIEPSHGLTASAFLAATTSKPPAGATVTKVSGIGDAAVLIKFPDGDQSIYLLAGKFTVDVAGLKTTTTGVEQLARQVLAG